MASSSHGRRPPSRTVTTTSAVKNERCGALVPQHRGFDMLSGPQDGQVLGVDEHLDAAGLAWLAADQACAFEGQHHLVDRWRADAEVRSEEHTSELQSLMRISYAVFCLITKTSDISNRKKVK